MKPDTKLQQDPDAIGRRVDDPAQRGRMSIQTEPHQDSIAIVWSVEDVAERCAQLGIDLSPDEQRRVLGSLKRNHDATVGICWEVIDAGIRMLEGQRQEGSAG